MELGAGVVSVSPPPRGTYESKVLESQHRPLLVVSIQ